MRNLCRACGNSFDLYNRGNVNVDIPQVCSPACFQNIIATHLTNESYSKVGSLINEGRMWLQEDRANTFRSNYEKRFAKWLVGSDLPWVYEPYTFRLSSGRTYTPDFYLYKHGTFIEVKGIWEAGSKVKFKLFKKEFDFNAYVMDLKALQLLCK